MRYILLGILVFTYSFVGFSKIIEEQVKKISHDGLSIVAVGAAGLARVRIAFINKKKPTTFVSRLESEFIKIVKNDLSFYTKYFEIKNSDSKKSDVFLNSKLIPDYSLWLRDSVDYLVNVYAQKDLKSIDFIWSLYDIKRKKNSLEMKVSLKLDKKLNKLPRMMAHKLSDQLYLTLTGNESVFSNKIVFVSDKNSTVKTYRGKKYKKVIKELYLMDFDGHNLRQLTHHNSIVLSPSFSKDGQKILYSLIDSKNNIRNINLYLYDLKTGKSRVISSKRGLNSGAIFSDEKNKVILTLSKSGNADIYELNLITGKARKITNHYGIDVDPSFTSNGPRMVFLSTRSGKAMIYSLDPRGTERDVKRISFVGKFNATPRFSPDGKEIVFSSWLDGSFDIFRIDSKGNGLVRLTKDFGSNEDPSFSQNAQFILFTSRKMVKKKRSLSKIFVMDRDGEILNLHINDQKLGDCLSPKWSNSKI